MDAFIITPYLKGIKNLKDPLNRSRHSMLVDFKRLVKMSLLNLG